MALLKAFVCQVILIGLYKLFLEQVVEDHLVPDELTRNCLVGVVCLLCFGIQLYTDIPGDEDAEADEADKTGAKSESRGAKNVTITPNMPDTIPNVIKVDGMGEPEVPVSTAQTSYGKETTNPVLNGFSEASEYEESDEDGIEIDQFISKEPAKEEAEQLKAFKSEEVEPIKDVNVTEDAKQLRIDDSKELEVIDSEDVTEESRQMKTIEDVEVEAIESEDVTETVAESECLPVNGEVFSSMKDSSTSSKTGESSKAEITNDIDEDSSNNTDHLSLNTIGKIESKESVMDEGKTGNGQDTILSSELDKIEKNIIELQPYSQEMKTNLASTKSVSNVETMNKNNLETSILVKTPVSPPSEKSTVSTARHKATAAGDVFLAPVTIDISFIYACH